MKRIKPHFWYTKSQRNGVLFLLLCIIIFQAIYVFVDFSPSFELGENNSELLSLEKKIDSLQRIEKENRKPKIYPFNPNFITDFKGYQLGMSLEEIDRLHQFRAKNKFVNSAQEFQKVTKVSDSLLLKTAPFFKFPDWVTKQKQNKSKTGYSFTQNSTASTSDINVATQVDFQSVQGIDVKLSERIIKYRSKLQGFSFPDQLYEVWGINKIQVENILKTFSIKTRPEISVMNVNTASFKELLRVPYIDYELCKKILDYRDEVAELQNISELRNIKDFPQNKYDRIVLYLKAE